MERDHAFLEQADIDSLVRRLNILNRCADLMEEIKSKKVGFAKEVTINTLSVLHVSSSMSLLQGNVS